MLQEVALGRTTDNPITPPQRTGRSVLTVADPATIFSTSRGQNPGRVGVEETYWESVVVALVPPRRENLLMMVAGVALIDSVAEAGAPFKSGPGYGLSPRRPGREGHGDQVGGVARPPLGVRGAPFPGPSRAKPDEGCRSGSSGFAAGPSSCPHRLDACRRHFAGREPKSRLPSHREAKFSLSLRGAWPCMLSSPIQARER